MTVEARAELVQVGRDLTAAGLAPGTSGNISIRIGDDVVVTPTGVRLGALDADSLSVVDLDGRHTSGPKPTKESLFHAAAYRARSDVRAVVHVHSRAVMALSCLPDLDPVEPIPNLTPYFVMRVGPVTLLPYLPPGDPGLADVVGRGAATSDAMVLARHGSVLLGASLADAAAATEELEAAADLYLTLRPLGYTELSAPEVAELRRRYPR